MKSFVEDKTDFFFPEALKSYWSHRVITSLEIQFCVHSSALNFK